MSTPCSICSGPDREAIDAALRSGMSLRAVAARFGCSYSTIQRHARRTAVEAATPSPAPAKGATAEIVVGPEGGELSTGTLDHPLDLSTAWDGVLTGFGLDPAVFYVVGDTVRMSKWQTSKRTDDGDRDVVWLYSYKARFARRVAEEAEAEELRRAAPVSITFRSTNRLPVRRPTSLKCAVIYGDAQIGYFQDREGEWRPFHDESALDVSHQIAADVESEHGIDVQVDVGDLIDFPMFSHHPSATKAVVHGAAQRALDRAHAELRTRAEIAKSSERNVWVRGNHDDRLARWISEHAVGLVGLRRAGHLTEDPLLSLSYMLALEESGWTQSGRAYPNDVYWLNRNTRIIHGELANSNPGKTLAALLAQEVNTFQGHTPHAGTAYRTVARAGETRTYVAHIVPGFMRTDNVVPAQTSRGDDYGVPSDSDGKPWEQGFSVVFFDPEGKTVPQIEFIPIFAGRAVWRGKEYQSLVDVNGEPIGAEPEAVS